MTFSAYAILAVLYTLTMCAGYATFGDVCKGNILLNYHPSDLLSTIGRIATGLSLIFGFPLVSNCAREGLKNAASALGYPYMSDPKNHFKVATGFLFATTMLSIFLVDIKLVTGLTGAVFGSFLVYISPTVIYSRIVRQLKGVDSTEYRLAKFYLVLVPFGFFVASLGVYSTLKNTVLV
jgi:amino acid permease